MNEAFSILELQTAVVNLKKRGISKINSGTIKAVLESVIDEAKHNRIVNAKWYAKIKYQKELGGETK